MASTSHTIRNSRPWRPARAALLSVALVWGALLLGGAARPLWGELLAAFPTLLADFRPAPPPTLPALAAEADRLDQAARLSPSADRLMRAAIARRHLADAYGLQSDPGRDEAERSLLLMRQSLAAAPVNSFGWLFLSQLEAQAHGVSALSAHAWRLSYVAAPFDPDLDRDRLLLGLLQRDAFDEGDRAALAALIRFDAGWRMEDLIAPSIQADATATVRQVLRQDPVLLADYDHRVARYVPGQ
jgi:hypothetical protein